MTPPAEVPGTPMQREPRFRALADTPLAAAAPGIDVCVHCGFCLEACPTYLTLEDENDSPRGRIVLMRSLLEGTLAPTDPSVHDHISKCLGCRACETVCPSGVPYGHLLEATRATLARSKPPPPIARLILAVFARRWMLAAALAAGRFARAIGFARLLSRLPGRFGFAMAMLNASRPVVARTPGAASPRSRGPKGRSAMLEGCVMRGLFGHVNDATRVVVEASGYEIVEVAGQGCCGALHAHAGDLDGARELARTNVAAFERADADVVVVNAAGCGAMMKEYGAILAGDPEWSARAAAVAARIRDVSEVVATTPVAAAAEPGTVRATYSPPCHLRHAQRLTDPPARMIGAIPGLDLVPLGEADLCCGAAGIYNLIEPETSDLVLARKLERIAESGARLVLNGNPGCLMQIGAGLARNGSTARAVHPVELLAASLEPRDG